jgi:hypothetical protein
MTLRDRVRREARALSWRTRGVHASAAVGVLLVGLALGAWLLTDGRWLAWPRGVPLLVWGAAAGVAALAWRVARGRVPLPATSDGVAYGIEAEQGLRPGSLRGALEIGTLDGALARRAVADVEARLGRAEVLLPAARQRATRSLVGGLAGALAAVALVALVSSRARDGFAAVLHPLDAWRGLLLPALAFEAVPEEMPRGMPLTVRVRAPGRSALVVSVRTAGAAWTVDTIAVDPATSLATLDVGPVRAPITVRADDGRAPILERAIAVGDRGWIGDLQVVATYPTYLARPGERLDLAAGVRVPRGTTLRVQAATYAGAHDVRLVNEAGDTVRFAAAGGDAIEARVVVAEDRRWQWLAAASPNADGARLPVELPEPLAVAMIADEAPMVEILAPASDTTVGTTGRVLLALGASDDHALEALSLRVTRERADGGREQPTRVALGSVDAPVWEGVHELVLDGRRLEAGDRLIVVAEATDASPWRQLGASRPLVLRVPTAEEQRAIARSLADSLMARADAIAAAERALQRSTSEAARARELQGGANPSGQPNQSEGARSQSMSYESAEKMRSLAQQQRDLGDRVEDLKQGARELEQRLGESGAMDKELQARFNELQKMLRDAMTPEMQQRLAELEQNAERLSGSEVRQSLEQLAAQQRQLREQLEKSAEMLKRAALEGSMETLRDEAKELAQQERQMADELAKPGASGRAPSSRAARDLAARSERLERDVQALTERLRREGAEAGASKTQDAKPDVEAARQAMQEAAQQLADRLREVGARLPGDQQGAQTPPGQQQPGQQQPGQRQPGQQPGPPGQQQAGQRQPGQQPQPGQQAGQQPGGQQGAGQQGAGQGGGSPQDRQAAAQQAQRAADAMERAADQLGAAREAQVDAWKQDLSQQLDQAINETAQLARQQQQLAERAQQDGFPQGMQGEQGALQQGVQQAAQRLEEAGRGSALLSQRSQRAMAEAQQRVQQATQAAGAAGQPGGNERAEGAMRDAAQALNQALASLVRDRERVNNANSASGFSEMLEQMKQLAQQQGNVNGQMQGLQQLLQQQQGAQGRQMAQQQGRMVARQQREIAEGLQDVADIDPTGRLEALAREAQQVAQALDRGGPDPNVAARQQQLYRRLLDAGRFMEQEERDDQGPREARAGDGRGTTRATGTASGRDGVRFAPPSWNDLRGLNADERRLVYEYFRRLNGTPP